jgi:hypothetical protein
MPGNDPIVQELRDRMAIRDLIMRYAHSVDARDFVGVASCFTADAAYQGSLGVGTIADALDSLRVRMQRFRVTMHFLSTQVIELAGASAAVRSASSSNASTQWFCSRGNRRRRDQEVGRAARRREQSPLTGCTARRRGRRIRPGRS